MVDEKQEKAAKYEMLLTWLKAAPKSADKVRVRKGRCDNN